MTVKHWAGCFLSHSGLGNRFSVPFLMTCFYSGVVCHSTNSAIWGRMNNERPEKVVNHVLRSKKMAGQISSAFAANLIFPAEPEEENLRSVCSPFFFISDCFSLVYHNNNFDHSHSAYSHSRRDQKAPIFSNFI